MTRVLSYNILIGGSKRIEKLARLIESANTDIIGLVEATDSLVVETLAQRLHMHYAMSGRGKNDRDWQVALLSRFPIIATKVHTYPKIMTRRHILETTVEEPDGTQITAFVVHLTADFYNGAAANRKRRGEIQLALSLMAQKSGTPHLIMGDFNSIAPHEPVYGSKLLRYQLHEREKYYQRIAAVSNFQVHHKTEMTLRSYILRPMVRFVLTNSILCTVIDKVGARYAQGGFDQLQSAGYIDCFRTMNPNALGFTCPSSALAGRIDFIFASPELAARLTASDVIAEGNGVRGEEASDHLPVIADFS